jgi:hypothetical protein
MSHAGAAATQADHDLTLKQLQCTLRRQDAAHERHNTPTAALAAVRKALPTATAVPSGTAGIVASRSLHEVTSSTRNAKVPMLASEPITAAPSKSEARSRSRPRATVSAKAEKRASAELDRRARQLSIKRRHLV